MLGVIKGMITTWKSHWRKPVTVQYPDEILPLAPRYWGFPGLIYDHEVDEPFCVGCQVCARYCPTDAIFVTMKDNPKYKEGTSKRRKMVDVFELNISRCISCNICVEVCNFDAIEMTDTFEEAHYYPDVVADIPELIKMSEKKRDAVLTRPVKETR